MIKSNSKMGFSLIEILITLSIMGILMTMAYPIYSIHLHKVRRVDAQIALLNAAFHLQQYYAEHQEYTGATIEGFNLTGLSPQKYYTISISELSAISYILIATPRYPHHHDPCGLITLNALNVKGPSEECWS